MADHLDDYVNAAARALELFGELRSETRPDDLVKQMSGGQRQAVAIARTRLSNARLVMMDEPTAAISVRQVEQVLGLIHRLKEQGVAVMLITHDLGVVAGMADRVAVMYAGRIVETGGPELALELEQHGYAWLKDRVPPEKVA